MVCKRLTSKSWGCKISIMRWLCTIVVRPIVTQSIANFDRPSVIEKLTYLRRCFWGSAHMPNRSSNAGDQETALQSKKRRVNFTMKFKAGNKADWKDSTLELLLRVSTIQWYTDGSRTSKGISASTVGSSSNLSIPMGYISSVFQAEVFAIS